MTNKSYNNAKEVAAVEPQEMYTARLEFKSIGDTSQVQPFFSWSHHFPEDYMGPWPAAFIAMRDIGMMLAREAQLVYNTEVDDLPDDPDEQAAITIGMAQKQSATVN